ncbi:uncharacterized protein SAPINGB_P006360 [Magnusiomyces paraingens]|uniref:Uncharacterized protein n=1 Tax=Magnusiomyces paraingens TaxID=2606893 RepID=A0A5E8C6P7_9ASCO|nr:uncharacterized protein SAPINGB_P006360 [Saprochaete ingens]VVT58740.1 unnamed protein product [Saprochaete ingens]
MEYLKYELEQLSELATGELNATNIKHLDVPSDFDDWCSGLITYLDDQDLDTLRDFFQETSSDYDELVENDYVLDTVPKFLQVYVADTVSHPEIRRTALQAAKSFTDPARFFRSIEKSCVNSAEKLD